MRIRAALLDLDGTLFDGGIDWLALREQIEIPWDGRPILAQLRDAAPELRERGLALLHRAERDGAQRGGLLPGAEEFLAFLVDRGIRRVLVTNNSRRSADTVLARFSLPLDVVLTRDDGAYKPDPEALLSGLRQVGVSPSEAVAIGDAHLDLIAAHRAGVREIILVRFAEWMKAHVPPDARYHTAADLFEVRSLLASLLDGGTSAPS